jgi:DNA repair exonuclease SbcCD ATPase subunit
MTEKLQKQIQFLLQKGDELARENLDLQHDLKKAVKERDDLYRALEELVDLKRIKETYGKTSEYFARVGPAWTGAKFLLIEVTTPEDKVIHP